MPVPSMPVAWDREDRSTWGEGGRVPVSTGIARTPRRRQGILPHVVEGRGVSGSVSDSAASARGGSVWAAPVAAVGGKEYYDA